MPIDELAKNLHYDPLSVEVRAIVIATWERGGLLPRAVIEKVVPAKDGDVNVQLVEVETTQTA
jgi:hypothetical protein